MTVAGDCQVAIYTDPHLGPWRILVDGRESQQGYSVMVQVPEGGTVMVDFVNSAPLPTVTPAPPTTSPR